MSRLVFGFMYLLHFLPLRIQATIGNAVGTAIFWLIPERRKVVRINLALCFPERNESERERLARAHFRAFCRSFLERGLLWWAPRERIRALVRLEGLDNLTAISGSRPVILFVPHFVGLDAALTRLSLEFPVAMMYSRQKDPRFEKLMLRGRSRFGGKMIARQAGVKEGL